MKHNIRAGILGDHICCNCGRTQEDIEDNGLDCRTIDKKPTKLLIFPDQLEDALKLIKSNTSEKL